ncbi:hypothetical protein L9F63_014268, partial [Diploptera punctata]
ENWVCDKETYVPNTLSFTKIGEVIGTLIIGQLGDTVHVHYIFHAYLHAYVSSYKSLTLGRCVAIVSANHYFIFLVACILAGLHNGVVFQAPLIIGMEISSVRLRAQIALLQCVGWTSGMCLMPMIAWITGGNWKLFTLITSLPCAAVFIVYRTFPESPRWLATRGKTRQCLQVLNQIARVNGTAVPENAMEVLQNLKGNREKVYGLASLCSSKQLLRNTALICTLRWYSCTLVQLVSFSIILNVANMSGNPFINMFLQAIVELPAYLVGKLVCDKYGRRWSEAGAILVSAAFQFICIAVVLDIHTNSGQKEYNSILVLIVKFCITVAAYCAYLRCMEIYPTCLRQTGTSAAVLVSMGFGSLGPYIVFLGDSIRYEVRYPYGILGSLCILGTICSLLMPETLNQKLPETLQDSAHFGKNQEFWNFPWKSRNQKYVPTATVKRN